MGHTHQSRAERIQHTECDFERRRGPTSLDISHCRYADVGEICQIELRQPENVSSLRYELCECSQRPDIRPSPPAWMWARQLCS